MPFLEHLVTVGLLTEELVNMGQLRRLFTRKFKSEAVKLESAGLLHHSDCGSQYATPLYREVLVNHLRHRWRKPHIVPCASPKRIRLGNPSVSPASDLSAV